MEPASLSQTEAESRQKCEDDPSRVQRKLVLEGDQMARLSEMGVRGSRGFSLISVMVALALASIVLVGVLEITKSLTYTAGLTEVRSEINNQLFEIRVALQDVDVCTANLKGQKLTAGGVNSLSFLRPIGQNGDLDMNRTLLPVRGNGNLVRAFAGNYRIVRKTTAASPNIVTLQLTFESSLGLAGTTSFQREVPLFAQFDSDDKIIGCTANPNGLTDPKKLVGGCSLDSFPSDFGGGLPQAAKAQRKKTLSLICSGLSYPTGTKPVLTPNVMSQIYSMATTSKDGLGRLPGYDPRFEILDQSGQGYLVGSAYHHLASMDECKALPDASPMTLVNASTSQSKASLSCIGGEWRLTEYSPRTIVGGTDSGGTAE